MNHDEKEKLKSDIIEAMRDVFIASHSVVVKNSSITGSDIAVIKEHLSNIDKDISNICKENVIRNGSFSKAVDGLNSKIADLDKSKTEIQSSIVGANMMAKWAVGIITFLMVSISSLGLYAYEKDQTNLKENDSKLAKDLVDYKNTTSVNVEKIFQLLNQIKESK